MKNLISILFVSLNLALIACDEQTQWNDSSGNWVETGDTNKPIKLSDTIHFQTEAAKTAHHATFQLKQNTVYDGSWVNIGYPGGDPGYQQGVCTDVVIRTLRRLDFDLQKEMHIDMTNNFDKYPKYWVDNKPDSNIDHRRVYNQMTSTLSMN